MTMSKNIQYTNVLTSKKYLVVNGLISMAAHLGHDKIFIFCFPKQIKIYNFVSATEKIFFLFSQAKENNVWFSQANKNL